jgi:hypothetical protein
MDVKIELYQKNGTKIEEYNTFYMNKYKDVSKMIVYLYDIGKKIIFPDEKEGYFFSKTMEMDISTGTQKLNSYNFGFKNNIETVKVKIYKDGQIENKGNITIEKI